MKRIGILGLILFVPACTDLPRALDPAGPQAEQLAQLSWVLLVGSALILIGVMLIAAYAVFGPEHRRSALARRGLVIGGGIVFPVLTLTGLMLYAFSTHDRFTDQGEVALRIEVTGEQFWWRVRYLDENGNALFETANEIHIPMGQTVELRLIAADVIHSFWVPNLAGKLDMIPGKSNVLRLQAAKTGAYRGQCAEYCGTQHANMAFLVIAEEPEAFAQWLTQEKRDATNRANSSAQTLFEARCGACHRIRGTAARGTLGPDLTHVGSRRTLGAGLLPNHLAAMNGWIANAQALKPGNRMPAFNDQSGAELQLLSDYLMSLR